MSRSFFRKRSGVITGDLVQSPVATIAALRLVAVQDIDDGQLIYVKAVDRMYGFKRGDTTADDAAAVIAPTYNATAGRWHAVSSIATELTAADIPIADADDNFTAEDVEAALAELAEDVAAIPTPPVNFDDLADVAVSTATDGDYVVYDQPSTTWKPTKKTMVGSKSLSGLASLDLVGVSQRKVGTPQGVPLTKGSRIHVAVSAVLNVVNGGALVPPPNNLVWIGFNFQDSSGVPGGTFVSGNIADLTYNNSEITIHATFLVADATSGLSTERDIIASGLCIQAIDPSTTAASTLRRLNRTPPPSAQAAYDATGHQVTNLAETNAYLQLSIEATNSAMTLTDHYAVVVKGVTIDFSRGG